VSQISSTKMGSINIAEAKHGFLGARSGLRSNWPVIVDRSGSGIPARFEGEIGDLVVDGDIPPEIRGTFYRISLDRYMPNENGIPLDGDG